MANHPLQSSGVISLNDISMEFDRASGTTTSLSNARNQIYGTINVSILPNPLTGLNSVTSQPKDGYHVSDWYGYNHNASVVMNFAAGFDSPNVGVITLQTDNKILCGGAFSNYTGTPADSIVRLNTDGSRDVPFTSAAPTGFDGQVYSIVVNQFDNKITIGGGYDTFNGITRRGLVRLNSDGTFDGTFFSNMGSGFSLVNTDIHGIGLQSDGKIVLVGNLTAFNGTSLRGNILRLNADGTEDTAFSTNVGSGINPVPFNTSTFTVCLQDLDGKILVGGTFSQHNGVTRNRLVRLNSDGTEDTAFYSNLGSGFDTTAGHYVNIVKQQTDNKILVGGSFTSLNGITRNYLVRLNLNGTVDTAFYTNLGSAFNAQIEGITIQSDGKILVAGDFTTFKGNTRNRLVRLNSDGTEDTVFYGNLGTAFNNYVQCTTIQADSTILVGGGFTSVNGVTRNRICQLSALGVPLA